MPSTLTTELLVSLDGWAGSDDLPGYFGYLRPDLDGLDGGGVGATSRGGDGGRIYELLNDLPDEAKHPHLGRPGERKGGRRPPRRGATAQGQI